MSRHVLTAAFVWLLARRPREIFLLFIALNKFKLIFLRTPPKQNRTGDKPVLLFWSQPTRLLSNMSPGAGPPAVTRSLVSQGNRCWDDRRGETLWCSAVGGVCSHLLTDEGTPERSRALPSARIKAEPVCSPSALSQIPATAPPHFVRHVVDSDIGPRQPIRCLLWTSGRVLIPVCIWGVFDALIISH